MEYKLLKNLSVLCKRTQEIGSKKKIILKISKYPYRQGRPFYEWKDLLAQNCILNTKQTLCFYLVNSLLVEVTGFEPVSKHILQKLSTCLFVH